MKETRNIERLFHTCREIDEVNIQIYPELSFDEFCYMEHVFASDSSMIYIFPYVRVIREIRFVDIYIWDLMLYPKNYIRFVIAPGYSFSEKYESIFLNYIRGEFSGLDNKCMDRFNADIMSIFPDWNYIPYSKWNISMAIEHIYYSSHKSGCREILYKSRLSYIAYNLSDVPSYNLIGTTPSLIIGHGIQIKLLRILNQPKLIGYLFYEEGMELSKAVYEKYSDYITEIPTPAQWEYLVALYKNNGCFAGHGFMKILYDRLSSETYEDNILDSYERFIVLRDKCIEYGLGKIKMPDVWAVQYMVEKMEEIEECERNLYLNSLIRERKIDGEYDYIGDDYSVIMPDSMIDFFREAFIQHNCLLECDYASDHAYNECTILFVRQTANMDKPFVTIEVVDGKITQVYAKNDTLPGIEVFVFLRKYARVKGLSIDIKELILTEVEICEHAEFYTPNNNYELRKYAVEYIE